jgi:hypothetical protein
LDKGLLWGIMEWYVLFLIGSGALVPDLFYARVSCDAVGCQR